MLIRSGQHDVVTIVEIEARTHNGSASSAIGVTTQGRRVEVTWDDPVPVTKGIRVAVTYTSATPHSAVPADEVTQRALASLEHEANIGKVLETAGAALLLGAAFAHYQMRTSLRRPRSWPTA